MSSFSSQPEDDVIIIDLASSNNSSPSKRKDEFVDANYRNIGSTKKRKKHKTKSRTILVPTKVKYRARNRNKVKDPLLIVNEFEKEYAKRNKEKAKTLPIPQELIDILNEGKKAKKPKQTAQQRHDEKLKRNDEEIQFMVMCNNGVSENGLKSKYDKTKKEENEESRDKAINGTASKYPNMLKVSDEASWTNRNIKTLKVAVFPFPEYQNVKSIKELNLEEPGYPVIDKYFCYKQKDPHQHIKNDYDLIKIWQENKEMVGMYDYKNYAQLHTKNRYSLKEFREEIRRYCTGKKDKDRNALNVRNYHFIDVWREKGTEFNPPSIQCIQCRMYLDAIPISCIGSGTVFNQNRQQKWPVFIYIVALICSNYPNCTFPRCRDSFNKHWVKIAWYNDINGKEWKIKKKKEEKQKKEKQDKEEKKEKKDEKLRLKKSKKRKEEEKEREKERKIQIAVQIAKRDRDRKRKRDEMDNYNYNDNEAQIKKQRYSFSDDDEEHQDEDEEDEDYDLMNSSSTDQDNDIINNNYSENMSSAPSLSSLSSLSPLSSISPDMTSSININETFSFSSTSFGSGLILPVIDYDIN